jgi:hypothetical protein
MNKITYAALLVFVPVLISSCDSKLFGGKKKKKGKTELAANQLIDTSVTSKPPVVTITNVPVPTPGNDALISQLAPLWNTRIQYQTLSGKVKIGLEGPDLSHDLDANFRIAKDSIVWVHVRALGGLVSVARIFVTRDSFFMMNYQAKEFTRLSLADVSKILPVTVKFNQLQNLFAGDPLAEGTVTQAEVKDSSWSLHTEDSSFLQQITYQKADSTMSLGFLQTHDPASPTAMIDYHNYEAMAGRRISTNRVVRVQNGMKTYTLDMSFMNLEFDKVLEYPFNVPANYTIKDK